MASKKTTSRKAERPSYENKAVAPAALDKTFVRVRVAKAHDGLEEGTVLSRPYSVAKEIVNLGYWEII